ncbi:hypothetical protein D3C86_2104420 [compost metagenome]
MFGTSRNSSEHVARGALVGAIFGASEFFVVTALARALAESASSRAARLEARGSSSS